MPAGHDGGTIDKRDIVVPSAREIYEMIREAAYYRAEKRGFAPGLEAEDWLQAEAEVMARVRPSGPAAAP
jgi:hypothetical protein